MNVQTCETNEKTDQADKCIFIEGEMGRDLSIIMSYQEKDIKIFDRSVEGHKAEHIKQL